MLSELSVKVAESLYTTQMKPKDVAVALVALRSVGEHLHRWSEEPSVAQIEQKKSWAINIPLQCTPPERLKELAIASNGGSAPEPVHKAQSGGPFPIRPEHVGAGGDGPDHEKGDPKKQGGEKKDEVGVERHHDQDGDERPAPEYRTLKPELDALLRPQVPLPSESQADKDGPEEQRKIILQNLALLRAQWRGQRR